LSTIDETGSAPSESPAPERPGKTFLCVVDESEEFGAALRFACGRAHSTDGRVALLYVMQPAEFQHWIAVGERMREEAREEAEEMLRVVASVVQKRVGKTPTVYIREGTVREEVVKLIDEERDVSFLVLGAATGTDGPGPLVTYLVEKMTDQLRVPVTIVPGGLSDEEIDAIV